MSAYLIADVLVHDTAGYEDYRRGAQDALKPYGGRYLARGGKTVMLDGSPPPNLKFPPISCLK